MKVAVVWPAAIVTVAGTVATEVELLERFTTAPPVPAGALIVTVPIDVPPPVTKVGLRLKEARANGFSVSDAVFATDP